MLGVEKMDERLLAAVLASPFVITMVGFAVAIAFAPSVPNEIAPATEPRPPRLRNPGQA